METKLNAITPSYHSFVDDQILTAPQLNQFLNYFDDQDRLSRICLSGVGIACGFKLAYDPSAYALTITQGAGVTTDGDLLFLSRIDPSDPALLDPDIPGHQLTYKNYVPFADDKAQYPPFWPSGVQMPLYELIPTDEVQDEQPLSNLSGLDNMVVLLYLESYLTSPELCAGISCENQGQDNVQKLRVLLVSKENADYILSLDTMFNAHYLIQTYLNLDDAALQRVIVDANNSDTLSDLRTSYLNAMQAEGIIGKLKSGFRKMLEKLDMEERADAIDSLLSGIFGTGVTQPVMYFQYRYDLLRDVVDAYNELKALFMDSVCDCFPDIKSFRKHLMLGKLVPSADDRFLKPYRHAFYESPILRKHDPCCGQFRNDVDRVIHMLHEFIQTDIPAGEIKIIPSGYRVPLARKAIPFYYKLQQALLDTWNYEKYLVNRQGRNLSYHTGLLDQIGPVQFPLKYDLEGHNFLRIEGHQGYDYKTALDRINAIKVNNGLAFDLKALGINNNTTESINIADYQCEFEDLNVLLDAWTQEHECLLGKVSYYLSAFSTQVPAYNFHEVDFFNPALPSVKEPAVKEDKYNAVLDKALDQDGALGKILVPAFRTYRGCSGRDIIAHVDQQIDALPFEKPDPRLIDATLKTPARMLSYAYVLLDKRPLTLPDLKPDVIGTIAVNAENLCTTARVGLTKYGNVNLSTSTALMLTTLSYDLTELCCSAEKLQLIYDEIEKRKQQILLGLSLASFYKKHPGLEHFAGTEPGGTFLLVYVENPVGNIPAGTVVADFTLPYLCCSDCSPVNFIMPAPPAALRITSNIFCIGNSSSPLELYPTPANGTVKMSPQVPGVFINGNQLLIDGAEVPDTLLGQPIHFTVNEQVTDAVLTIFRAPQFNFSVPPSPVTTNVVPFLPKFEPSNLDTSDYKFFWQFGDGTVSSEKAPTHTYKLPLDSNTVIVKLTVTPPDGACPVTVENKLTFAQVSVQMSQTTFCANDDKPYWVQAFPKGAFPNMAGPGLSVENDRYYFTPSQAGPGNSTIYVNGVPMLTLTVNPVPSANVLAKVTGDELVLTSNLENYDSYAWNFYDADGNTVHDQIINDLNPTIPLDSINVNEGISFTIELQATNHCASLNFRKTMVKPTPFATCTADSQTQIDAFYEAFIQTDASGFTESAMLIMQNVKYFYNEVMADYTEYLSGNQNGIIGNKLSDFIYRFYIELKNEALNNGPGTSVVSNLMSAYSNVMYLGLTLVRCQDEETFETEEIMNMLALLAKETDSSVTDSLPAFGIDINPNDANSMFLAAILALRTSGTDSWNAVNKLLSNVQNA